MRLAILVKVNRFKLHRFLALKQLFNGLLVDWWLFLLPEGKDFYTRDGKIIISLVTDKGRRLGPLVTRLLSCAGTKNPEVRGSKTPRFKVSERTGN